MDVVDLDKVLDDFEEDEERIAVGIVEKDGNANGFVHRSNTDSDTYSVNDKFSHIPYPQQVSNELPTPEGQLYKEPYGVPYKVSESIKSDGDFGVFTKLPVNINENKLVEDNSLQFGPGLDTLQQLQNNGVLEIRDLQSIDVGEVMVPNSEQFSTPAETNFIVANLEEVSNTVPNSGSMNNMYQGERLLTNHSSEVINVEKEDCHEGKKIVELKVKTTTELTSEDEMDLIQPVSNRGEANNTVYIPGNYLMPDSTVKCSLQTVTTGGDSSEAGPTDKGVGFDEAGDSVSDGDVEAYLEGLDRSLVSSEKTDTKCEELTLDGAGHVTNPYSDIVAVSDSIVNSEAGGGLLNMIQNSIPNSLQTETEHISNQQSQPVYDSLLANKETTDTTLPAVGNYSNAPASYPSQSADSYTANAQVGHSFESVTNETPQCNLLLNQNSSEIVDSVEHCDNSENVSTSSVTHEPAATNSLSREIAVSCSPAVTDAGSSLSAVEQLLCQDDSSSDGSGNPAESSLPTLQPTTTAESACPGVKPKEPTKLKRPSSLLGLSTVPFPAVTRVSKSQSLPRSFSMGKTDNCASVEKVNRVQEPVSANISQDIMSKDSRNVEVSGHGDAREPGTPGFNTDLTESRSEAGLVSQTDRQLSVMPEEPASFSEAGEVDQTMQMGTSHQGQQDTLPQRGPNLSREGRPESLNLPPFLGFPSRMPEGTCLSDTVDGSEIGRLRQSSESSDGPPSYLDLEGSGSEAGAVGGAAPEPRSALGTVAPVWVPDAEAPNCMQCESRFTFTKRRHHCRACGKVFCSTCCNLKCKLEYMGSKEARVCVACHEAILTAQSRSGPVDRSPNPNNPSEYCSTIPPHQQANAYAPAPTVLVPVGVLKREGSHRRGEPKQVMFSDGIRPGGDLTEGDEVTEAQLPVRSARKVQKVERSNGSAEGQAAGSRMKQMKVVESSRWSSLIPAVGLPPLIITASLNQGHSVDDNPTDEKVIQQLQSETGDPVLFMINPNLQCQVSMINLDCCVHRQCWCFTSKGLCTVGQDEVVIVLECLPEETTIPVDIFHHMQTLYEGASKGSTVSEMGHSIFTQTFLGSKDHGGFLYVRPSFQCLLKMSLPSPPYVFGILLQKWEMPWAKVFPIRLLLRLGAEYRYYPCPLISIRNRRPVFFEIGHTIMNLLADFRGYQYMLPQVKGLVIHMEDKKTVISLPKNRYQDLMKVVTSSNEHVMALGANFSMEADSHLVCIQNDDGNYQTQAINIQNKPRRVTGASFVVFNGALKSTSGLSAKSSIVEDGLMVQIPPESMGALKQSIKDMKNYSIACGSLTSAKPDEVITIQWGDEDRSVNLGVKSPVDNMGMDGIDSIHIHNGTDYMGENKVIRWTEVFFINDKDSAKLEPIDLSRLAESLAQAGCIALTPHLEHLRAAGMTKIGLRATIHSESVGYEVGSNGEKLPDMYMNDLDNELIPVIHNAASLNQEGPITLELVFYVLN